MAELRQTLPPLRGVWHTAGVLADAVLPRQGAHTIHSVFAPKSYGGWVMHALYLNLDACAYFSSVAGLLGGAGQSNYAAANTCIDTKCRCTQSRLM